MSDYAMMIANSPEFQEYLRKKKEKEEQEQKEKKEPEEEMVRLTTEEESK